MRRIVACVLIFGTLLGASAGFSAEVAFSNGTWEYQENTANEQTEEESYRELCGCGDSVCKGAKPGTPTEFGRTCITMGECVENKPSRGVKCLARGWSSPVIPTE